MASEQREGVPPDGGEAVTRPAPAASVDSTATVAYDPYAGRARRRTGPSRRFT